MFILMFLIGAFVIVFSIVTILEDDRIKKFKNLEGKYSNGKRTVRIKYDEFYNEGRVYEKNESYTWFSSPKELYEYLKNSNLDKID